MSTDPHTAPAASAPETFESLREPVAPTENLILGTVGGLAGMLIGTAIWVGITVATNFQIGYMAVGVGFLVGLGMRFAGRGYSPSFSVVGAALALLGCALGNLFTGCVIVAREFETTFGSVVANLDFETTSGIMKAMFSPMDILFYALGAWAGWKYSVISAE